MRRAGVLRLAAFALVLGCGPAWDTPRASAGPDVPPVSDAARAAAASPGAIDWCTRHLASDGYSCVWVKLLVVA